MKNCLICLKQILKSRHSEYHSKCVADAFGSTYIQPRINGTIDDFYQGARRQIRGFSLPGVQAKMGLATKLDGQKGSIVLSNIHGTHILKPPSPGYPNLPINEHVSQLIMRLLGFNVPYCGLLKFSGDNSIAYFIKRYDRLPNSKKVHQEDLLAALGITNSTKNVKYEGSYQLAAEAMREIGGIKLAAEFINRVISAYVIGNSDYHLKNISLIYPPDSGAISISPVYDFVNTQMYGIEGSLCLDLLTNEEEIETSGDSCNLKKADFFALGKTVDVPIKSIIDFINTVIKNQEHIFSLIDATMLTSGQKEQYRNLVMRRIEFLV